MKLKELHVGQRAEDDQTVYVIEPNALILVSKTNPTESGVIDWSCDHLSLCCWADHIPYEYLEREVSPLYSQHVVDDHYRGHLYSERMNSVLVEMHNNIVDQAQHLRKQRDTQAETIKRLQEEIHILRKELSESSMKYGNGNGQPCTEFEIELCKLINSHSMENASDTPDHILRNFLFQCLQAWNKNTKDRTKWYATSSEDAPSEPPCEGQPASPHRA